MRTWKIAGLAATFLVALTAAAQAMPPRVEEALKLIDEARSSEKPAELLQKAEATMAKFDPSPNGDKLILQGASQVQRAALRLEAGKRKREAMEALHEAVVAAREGRGALSTKLSAASTKVHHAGMLNR